MDIDFEEEKLKSLQISSLSEEEDEGGALDNDVEDADSDEIDDEEDQIPMTLGFADKPKNPWSSRRQYFPSKAGGSPAWLDPVNFPSGSSSLCDFCSEPLQFLLQVYAPLSEESTFHRTLFVFMCSSMSCLLRDQHEQWKRSPEVQSRSIKVFRCQLPRANPFYSSDAPAEDGSQQPLTAGAMLCDWCRAWKGDKICSSCRRVRYCSGKHQAAHWRSGSSSHKVLCQRLEASGKESELAASNSLWPEYEITCEDECDFDETMSNDNETGNALVSRSRTEGSDGNLMKYFKASDENSSWASFQERISSAPEQVLRYSSSSQAKPLWPISSGRPSKPDIPRCNHCGGTRAFEFQVLPQILYFFHVKDGEDSLDWATIAVYTCEASCEGGASYKEEFAWVQLSSQSISHQ
ncbi:programmed cell death protein 2-like [Salvia splendens]|uniref:programmed cell death protein 2-like n=1 Tax=Salvia splendens TaxID=180675 RepID=UPI001C27C497|nr:programmed cell death protein 2-like [Salvia splendens]